MAVAAILCGVACEEADPSTMDEPVDMGPAAVIPGDAGPSNGAVAHAGFVDSGAADVGPSDAADAVTRARWNPDTCQVDDDGSSGEPADLEVRSRVLAEDSDPNDAVDDGTTVYYPAILEASDCRFKVIGWGNGTTGSGGADYPAYFEHLAGYGFVVAVAHTNLTLNESAPILASIDLVRAESEDPSSIFFEKLDSAFGLMGKSQGAIAAGRDLSHPNAVAGVLIGSGSTPGSALTKPGLFATGDADFLRTLVLRSYEAAIGEAIFAQAAQEPNPDADPAAGHMDLNDRMGIVELSTSFMRCHLRGNQSACDHVRCASCQTEPWSAFETKNVP